MKGMKGPVRVRPNKPIRLGDVDPDFDGGYAGKDEARADLEKSLAKLRERQQLLYADSRYSLLVVLQAMDTGGKDGTIRHVLSGLNPVACTVTSFKVPSADDRAHDYLWRIHRSLPARGVIGVFNRSQYEDVLVVRVHNLVPRKVWKERYRQINEFERILSENGVRIVKFYLHISKAEQKRRLKARLADPAKNWKFSEADIAERKRWEDYIGAYEDAINKCSTEWAPWYVVPANVKWARDAMVARVLRETMESMPLAWPKVKKRILKIRIP
jgi:PPK2 family polyphosphate:nucleotide phosphotransferase